jgi:predicted N-acetyltransferase YhbS
MPSPLQIRPMLPAEIPLAVDWAAAEGWNPGLDDAAPFAAADPDGFLIGTIEGEPVATISLVGPDPSFGFLGFYIVAPAFRGRGHGLAIWSAALERRRFRTVGLDGVVAQQPNYAKSGFALAHRNVRYGGRVDPAALLTVEVGASREGGPGAASAGAAALPAPGGGVIVAIGAAFASAVTAYDRPFYPAGRTAFLIAWLTPTATRRGLALVRDGAVAGYGVARRCRTGAKIGPLFADDAAGAEALFRALAGLFPEGDIFLDPPEPHAAATALARRFDLAPVFETARMYRGPAPDLPIGRTFGITTFELG